MECPKCGKPLVLLADPPQAGGFEFSLYGCQKCDRWKMECWCVASSMGGTEDVSPEDAAVIMNTKDPYQLKQFMKAWQRRVIG